VTKTVTTGKTAGPPEEAIAAIARVVDQVVVDRAAVDRA
jgi:hypothetical protein